MFVHEVYGVDHLFNNAAMPALMGTLYVVATPIGNLEDVTQRAIRILREVQLIAAEDTRHTGKLLTHFDIKTPMISFHAFNEKAREVRLIAALASGDVALVSDAGTPGISDPGHSLVAAAIAAGHDVSPIPGPSALTAALSATGIVDGPFIFLGFLPRAKGERRSLLSKASAPGFGLVIYEAPGRVGSTLTELSEVVGDRRAAVARELTKIHEEFRSGTLSTLAAEYSEIAPRGEVVIVVEKSLVADNVTESAEAILSRLLSRDMKVTDAAKDAAALTGRPRSEMYDIARSIADELKRNTKNQSG